MIRKLQILCLGLTAALLGSLLTPRVAWGGAFVPPSRFSGAAYYRTTDQTGIAEDTYTQIGAETERYDTAEALASGVYTSPTAGYISVGVDTTLTCNNATTVVLAIYKNGSIVSASTRCLYVPSANQQRQITAGWTQATAAGDTWAVYFRHTDGTASVLGDTTVNSQTGATEVRFEVRQ